jgi:hypothetical protein
MAKLGLRFNQRIPVGFRDVDVVVRNDNGSKLGTLRISQGTIDWVPGNAKTAYKMRWKRFGALMEEEGTAKPANPHF